MMIEGIDLTLGVEEEYQIINPGTRDLDSYVRQLLEDGGHFTPDSAVRPELMQSQIEAGSSVCSSVPEVRSEIIRMRRQVGKLAAEAGERPRKRGGTGQPPGRTLPANHPGKGNQRRPAISGLPAGQGGRGRR